MTPGALQLVRWGAACAACLAIVAAAPEARAQQQDAQTRLTAKKLAAEALALYDRGQYAEALEKFEIADQLVPAPTLGLQAARCLEKLGRLVEASERYSEVIKMKLERNAPFVHTKARAQALDERDKLASRIPSLEISIEGPAGKGVRVVLDGKPLQDALLGQKQSIDPGKHTVEARRADTTVKREVELKEGESARLALRMPPLPPPPKPLPKPAPPPSPLRTAGWIALGVGAGGVVLGAANGVAALVQQGALRDRCPDRNCPPDAYGDLDLYDATRVISTVGFVVGAVGAAGGLSLILLTPAPEGETPEKPQAAMFVTWGGAGVRGIF